MRGEFYMTESIIRDRVMKEIKLIPEHKLSEVYDFIHYFRIGLQKSKGNVDQIMKFAGCWKDMPEKIFNEFLQDIGQRRKKAFSRRGRSGACAG
jgi:heterodisulfide reductase subunit A-like polyferredoxin